MASDRLLASWRRTMAKLGERAGMRRLEQGKIDAEHYASFLVETYHNAGFNPQQQAFATAFLPGNPREVIKKFYQHAIAEIGHDLLALNDLVALGYDAERIRRSRPLPTTIGLTAYPIFQVQMRNPIGYLGYLYHLERLPTANGPRYIDALRENGVPEDGLTFVKEHAVVDVGHNKMMDFYIETLVKTEADYEELEASMRTAAHLHTLMIEGAFERADEPGWDRDFR